MAIRRVRKIIKTVKAKAYVRPAGEQIAFDPFQKKKIGFDFNITVPKDTMENFIKHAKKHRFKYELGATALTGYAGATIAQRRKNR